MKVIEAVQECSGLVVLVQWSNGKREWIRPPEHVQPWVIERMIEEAGIKVQGR